MSDPAVAGPLRLAAKPAFITGFLYGLRHPSLLVALAVDEDEHPGWCGEAEAILIDALKDRGDEFGVSEWQPPAMPAIAALLYGVHRLQIAAGIPVDPGRLVGASSARTVVALPTMANGHGATAAAVTWLIRLFDLVAAGADHRPHLTKVGPLLKALATQLSTSANVPRFLRAGGGLGFPIRELPGGILQFGNGRRARWLESSYTDATPRIGAMLARNKDLGGALLRQAGIPVPPHVKVQNDIAAVEAAEGLGYPVVVKPADKDGGVAVAAGLVSADEVRRAFAAANAVSTNVLVEKHFEGRDFRLIVLNSELIWSYERVPGGVTGDGIRTVAELVGAQNTEQSRGVGRGASLTPLVLDQEADGLLRRAGMTAGSVPAAGQVVRLRGAANIAAGGTPVSGVHGKVHPDNRRLAIRAAQALRLDLAGVDLLIPDIERSWLETGAAICEVNGQPNIGMVTSAHLYTPILRQLVEGSGRIPIAVVLGAAPDSGLARDIAGLMAAAGVTVGLVDRSGVSIAGETISAATDVLVAGQMLMVDRHVGAAVVSVDDLAVLRRGLAFDRFDILVIAGDHRPRSADTAFGDSELKTMLSALLPMCDGTILTGPEPVRIPRTVATAAKLLPPMPASELAGAAARLLHEAETRHAQR